MSYRGAPPIRRGYIPGGPNDDREALPVVVKCRLCDVVIDDGMTLPAPDIMRCPNCGPVCVDCSHDLEEGSPDGRKTCDGCGEELREGGA